MPPSLLLFFSVLWVFFPHKSPTFQYLSALHIQRISHERAVVDGRASKCQSLCYLSFLQSAHVVVYLGNKFIGLFSNLQGGLGFLLGLPTVCSIAKKRIANRNCSFKNVHFNVHYRFFAKVLLGAVLIVCYFTQTFIDIQPISIYTIRIVFISTQILTHKSPRRLRRTKFFKDIFRNVIVEIIS